MNCNPVNGAKRLTEEQLLDAGALKVDKRGKSGTLYYFGPNPNDHCEDQRVVIGRRYKGWVVFAVFSQVIICDIFEPSLEPDTGWKDKQYELFLKALYSSGGVQRIGAYSELSLLHERTKIHTDWAFMQIALLADGAHRLVEKREQIGPWLRTMRLQYGLSESPFNLQTEDERCFSFLSEVVESAYKEYTHIMARGDILGYVLEDFEKFGEPQKRRDLQNNSQIRTNFDLHLDAIQAACCSINIKEIRSNTELYRLAADVANLKYENDPANTLRKSVNKYFPMRFNKPVPENPDSWLAFFNSQPERAENVLIPLFREGRKNI